MSTVKIIVDDSDPRIQYSGSWTITSGNINQRNQQSRTGAVYNNTLHSSTKNGTSLSFRFNGTGWLGVYGTYDTTNSPGIEPPTCFLDGNFTWTFSTLTPGKLPTQLANNKLLCRADSRIGAADALPGEHELQVIHTDPQTALLFDYIVYESVPDSATDGEVLQISNQEVWDEDSNITFDAGWADNVDDSVISTEVNSSATVRFNGTGIQLLGTVLTNSSEATAGSYAIDNQQPVSFQYPFVNNSLPDSVFTTKKDQFTKQLLFNLSSLSPGEHTLVIINQAPNGTALDISYLFAQSLTKEEQASLFIPSTSPTSLAIPSPTSISSPLPPATSQSPKGHAGIIAGATLGFFVLIAFISGGIVLWQRRRLRRATGMTPFTAYTVSRSQQIITRADLKRAKAQGKEGDQDEGTEKAPLPSGSTSQEPNDMRVTNMKLQQRLAIMQDQVDQRGRELAERPAPRNEPMIEVPPNYSAV
ncbi:hypothetical protein D9758_010648 [Tetrapyrgos nigripes]|uniref:Uncharacterized protein n=1 Tax=Tetrapyrgos nigripes TaxID=182062 RepID=A0A8H5GGP8_9AGAR|nr:hypothetical protein D9758_010648 [Tetrapyrgos nigripes]